MELQTYGVRKYPPTSALLASSAGLGWSTISVELRSHRVSEAPAIVPQHAEICLVVAGNKDGLVRRTGCASTNSSLGAHDRMVLAPGKRWMGVGSVFMRSSAESSRRALCSRRLPQLDGARKQERHKHPQAWERQNHARMLLFPLRSFLCLGRRALQ